MSYIKVFKQDEDPADYNVVSKKDILNDRDFDKALVIKRHGSTFLLYNGGTVLFQSSDFNECVTYGLNWRSYE